MKIGYTIVGILFLSLGTVALIVGDKSLYVPFLAIGSVLFIYGTS